MVSSFPTRVVSRLSASVLSSLAFLLLLSSLASADIPSLYASVLSDGRSYLTINHSGSSADHYVDAVMFFVGGMPVSNVSLTEPRRTIPLDSLSVDGLSYLQAQAHCSVHGWGDLVFLSGLEGFEDRDKSRRVGDWYKRSERPGLPGPVPTSTMPPPASTTTAVAEPSLEGEGGFQGVLLYALIAVLVLLGVGLIWKYAFRGKEDDHAVFKGGLRDE